MKIDIIVPVLNEVSSLPELVKRINTSLTNADIEFQIIIVDDHSTDNTLNTVKLLKRQYPIKYLLKEGPIGKAFSILQGVNYSTSEYVAMLDGDLQYAPEYIPKMLEEASKKNYGVVIGNRTKHKENFVRRIASKIGNLIYARLILGIKQDTQSGLKLFKRSIVTHIDQKEIKPWAIDLPLLYTAKELGESIGSIDIDFIDRKNGQSKTNYVKTFYDIFLTSLKLKFHRKNVYKIESLQQNSMMGAGIVYKRKKYITHTTLHHSKLALVTFTLKQKITLLAIVVFFLIGLFLDAKSTAIGFIAFLSIIYFLDMFFGLFLVVRSLNTPPELKIDSTRIKRIKDKYLPIYTILSPLYKEAHVLPQFVENIAKLDWPKEKLDVILLLEEDDHETINAANQMALPSYFRILIVPNSNPKTKPKACNYGLSHAKGEYVVIYDAEDQPEPLQLKKALLGFQNVSPNVFCLQAKLNYYNPHQNLLTKLFTAEYSLWFDLILPGLQSIGTSIPLGGTSNHFRTLDLKNLEGWDPFNVAEDSDLGARIFRAGYKTAIIDSITLEEANSNLKNWIRQRSRWLKGYIQTYFVHMREPIKFAREQKIHYLIFQLVSGLRVFFTLFNPFLWLLTIAYFALHKFVGAQIESLYPAPVFYMAVISAVFGNFLYLYYYMIGVIKREEWGLVKYAFFVPFYWLLISVGTFMALYQLIFKPHFWEKTIHGLHLNKMSKKERIKLATSISLNPAYKERFEFLRTFIKTNLAGGGVLIFSSVVENFFNFLYNAYLGRELKVEDFGLITLFGSFLFILRIPVNALSRTVTHKTAFYLGKFNSPAKEFWRHIRRKSIQISLLATLIWILASPALQRFFNSDTIIPFLLFAPVILIGTMSAVDSGFISGNMMFIVLAILAISSSLIKFVVTFALVNLNLSVWVYVATPISMTISLLIGWYFARRVGERKDDVSEDSLKEFPAKFFYSSVIIKLSEIAFFTFDILLAKHYLSPVDAGRYSLISTVGKMIFFIGGLFSQFILPIVSREEGAARNSNRIFYKLFIASGAISFVCYLFVGLLGKYTTPLLFGEKINSVVSLLPIFGIGMFGFQIADTIISFEQARSKYLVAYISLILAFFQILGLAFFHTDLKQYVLVMSVIGILNLFAMLFVHFTYDKIKSFGRNLLDLVGLFSKLPEPRANEGKLKILVFNWRDLKHVWAGGAEVYIHELSKRWVKKGHEVTIFCGNDGKHPRYEVIDGIQIIRRGGFYTVFIWAFLYYIFRLRGKFDQIIDSENGIPFFTPLYARKNTLLLIHHVHQEVFRIRLKPPFSFVGKFLEKYLVPVVYKNTKVVTVSPSSKADILENNLTQKDPLVIYNGVDLSIYKPGLKSRNPLVLYLGRLSRQKSLSTFIKSAGQILEKVPKVEFVIAGDGDDKKSLISLTKELKLEDKIKFLGKVTEEEKVALYQKAWVFVNPSLMEGWGITTIEANACGTPVIASNVSGLRDAVQNPHSGFLVPYGDVQAFTNATVKLLKSKVIRTRMSKDSILWAKKFDWEVSADEFISAFKL